MRGRVGRGLIWDVWSYGRHDRPGPKRVPATRITTRRMSAGGALPAGPSLRPRLDPLPLPVRFRVATPDGRLRIVELQGERSPAAAHGLVLSSGLASDRTFCRTGEWKVVFRRTTIYAKLP